MEFIGFLGFGMIAILVGGFCAASFCKSKTPLDGAEAHAQGYSMSDNPYPEGRPGYEIWHKQWMDSSS